MIRRQKLAPRFASRFTLTTKVLLGSASLSGLLLSAAIIYTNINASQVTSGVVNTVSGIVFLDYNGDGIEDLMDFRHPAVGVLAYFDMDNSSTLTPGDSLVGSTSTDRYGAYSLSMDHSIETVSFSVEHEHDDAEENYANGNIDLSSSDLEMMYDGSTRQVIGIRFASVTLDPAKTLTGVYLRFRAKTSDAGSTTVSILGEKAKNSARFSATNRNISSRNPTTNTINWTIGAWTADEYYTTSNLKLVFDEITTSNGWASGDPITFGITGASGNKNAHAYSNSPPELMLEYEVTSAPVSNYIIVIDSTTIYPNSTIRAANMAVGSASNIHLSFQGQAALCFVASDGNPGDSVAYINPVSGNQGWLPGGGGTGTQYLEGISFARGGSTLYGFNAAQLGNLDIYSGTFSAKPLALGTLDGADGPLTIKDVDGVTLNPHTGTMWATARFSGQDLLFQVDTATGSHVPEAFGSGLDYVRITGTGVLEDIDDIAISPVSGKLYGFNNDGSGGAENLIEINPGNGSATIVGTVTYSGSNLTDIEGGGFDNYGNLLITTGSSGGNTANSLYQLDPSTAIATRITSMDEGDDYESCDCLVAAVNTISGTLYGDCNNNDTHDPGEPVLSNAVVRFYIDIDKNGLLTATDVLVDSVTSDAGGSYSWQTAANVEYLEEISPAYLPPSCNPAPKSRDFSDCFGGCNTGTNLTFPLEWAGFRAWLSDTDGHLEWKTLNEKNCHYFEIQRSTEKNIFEPVGRVEANGNTNSSSTYQYTDHEVARKGYPRLFYRIKQVDLNGQYTYSSLVELNVQAYLTPSLSFHLFPNPADEVLKVWLQHKPGRPVSLRVINLKGQNMWSHKVLDTQEEMEWIIPVADWPSGFYYVEISDGREKQTNKLLIR